MEHDLLQLVHLPTQDHLAMVNSAFSGTAGGEVVHVPSGDESSFVVPVTALAGLDDCGWMEDLMHLGDDLFTGDDNDAAGTGDHQQATSLCGGGSPLPSISMDEGNGSPPSVEQDDVSAATGKRRDRSKTIVSERKRRVRMKEKLYELRALVPNITKMDKASIIADAVMYVKNLQSHARKLTEEVAALETRLSSPSHHHQQQQKAVVGRRHQGRGSGPPPDGDDGRRTTGPAGARVTHVGATQVGDDGRFFVTVECERRDGVAAPLCAAVESLACFRVESSSLGRRSGPDRVVSTHVLEASDQSGDATIISEGTVKLWMTAALLKEGFQPEATVQIS